MGRAGAAALLAAGLLVVGTPASAQEEAATARHPYTVTLVTGDRVTVSSASATQASVDPAPGREHVSFSVSSVGGHLLVIPSDAARLVQTRRVDRRLFDVTELIRLGYDDRARSTVPLIMGSRSAGGLPGVKRTVSAHGARTRELPAVKVLAVAAPKATTSSLWEALTTTSAEAVRTIWLDGKRQPLLDKSVARIGAPAAWQSGLTGKGISVAVLDSGVDASHPDLSGRVVEKKFTDQSGDQDGHGTHVASIIAGTGAASQGRYRGVAPEARVLSGKVCELQGCQESAILAGMQWAAVEQRARVINMSLGGANTPSVDPIEEAVNSLTAQTGALFVVAAGNSGSAPGSVESPGSADAALTVAAVDSADVVADSSSRGPRVDDEAIKPDIAAPGVDIVAARAAGTPMGDPTTEFPDSYVAASGTSMAAPHVAGAAVLLAQRRPDWKAAQLKATLMGSAARTADGAGFDQGAGRVDVARAIEQTMTADPPSVGFGLQQWPHDKDTALTKTVTYRNAGSAAATLELALTADNALTLSASRVEVPAGGTASVTITADTRALPPGVYSAHLVATGGEARVVTPVSIQKEAERYAVTLRHIGLDGKPVSNYFTQLFQPGGDDLLLPFDPSGTVTLRLPKGRYTAATYLDTSTAGDNSQLALLYQPILDVAGNTSVTFDARDGAPVRQSVPDRTAEAHGVSASVAMTLNGAPVVYGVKQTGFSNLRIGRLGTPVPATGAVTSAWARRDSGELAANSPYAYYVGEQVPSDALLTGYARAFRARELAAVTEKIRSYAPEQTGRQWMELYDAGGQYLGGGRLGIRAPGTRVNYFSTQAGLRWMPITGIGVKAEWGGIEGLNLTGSLRVLRPGSRSAQEWGAAPYVPAFNTSRPWIYRNGDILTATVPPVTDSGGNAGFDTTQTVSTKLFRGDELLSENSWITVGADGLPDEAATYRVEQDATGDIGGLATRTRSVLSFRDPASVLTVRYAPRLDRQDAVRAGTTQRIPLTALDQTGKPVGIPQLGMAVSYDDGATWRDAQVSQGSATVQYPASKGYVSIRVHGKDAAGNEAMHTVIRAYRIR